MKDNKGNKYQWTNAKINGVLALGDTETMVLLQQSWIFPCFHAVPMFPQQPQTDENSPHLHGQ